MSHRLPIFTICQLGRLHMVLTRLSGQRSVTIFMTAECAPVLTTSSGTWRVFPRLIAKRRSAMCDALHRKSIRLTGASSKTHLDGHQRKVIERGC